MATKTSNQKAWFFVLPVVVLVALNALIPLMTVVNYSVQETFGDNLFFWAGVGWYEQVLASPRFHAALLRQLVFTAIILLIEVPLGVAIALSMPRKGPWVSVCLVLMALPLLALAVAARSRWVFALLAGTALFYAAHAKTLEPIGAAGCLFLGSLAFGAGFLIARLRSAS